MSRYVVESESRSGEALVVLRDSRTGAFARLWSGFGANCFEARVASPRGGLVDLLLAPDSLNTLRGHPSGWGIPLLFPSPGRIPKGEYEFRGRTYVMGGVDDTGNVMHGFALRRAWRVEGTAADDAGASATCSFSSDDHPDTLEGYPFPYRVEAMYRLDEGGLTLEATVVNAGSGDMPFGFGAHPYFRVPFTDEGRREDCRVVIPAARRWDLGMIGDVTGGTGVAGREVVVVPVEEGLDYRAGVALGERLLDDVLTGLVVRDGWTECSVADPGAGLVGVMRATAGFGTVVVYTPPGRPGLCFEPWTCPPNAFNLSARNIDNTGLVVLGPKERWKGAMVLSVRAAG